MPVVEALHMMGDLFWDVATSGAVLLAIGAIAIAAFVVAHVPFIRAIPAVAPYAVTASLVQVVAAALLMFLVGFRIADERQEAKTLRNELAAKQEDIEAANDAAKRADAARALLAKQSEQDQERIADYEERLRRRTPNAACTLGPDDFDGVPDHRKRAR
jgi:uncharacterized integral membrane protein